MADLSTLDLAGLSAAITALTAAIIKGIDKLVGAKREAAAEKAQEAAAEKARSDRDRVLGEVRSLAQKIAEMDKEDVRSQADRQRLDDAVKRLDREISGLRQRFEQQGVAVEAELRPLRENVAAVRAMLLRAGEP